MDSHIRQDFPPNMTDSWFLVISACITETSTCMLLTPEIDRATRPFLKFDTRHIIGPFDMQQGFPIDMRQGYFLNSTCDMGINK